ncbi:MAG: hypothetical protein HND56_02065 [Pseudomonadota bacterium]|jgi:hypothetical protein|nr:hypothetical protein [Pseudomonadota bacterium]QKK04547.1 MAG: hypothetical protein HND56_02065 [Pseudomonadota bacterium]
MIRLAIPDLVPAEVYTDRDGDLRVKVRPLSDKEGYTADIPMDVAKELQENLDYTVAEAKNLGLSHMQLENFRDMQKIFTKILGGTPAKKPRRRRNKKITPVRR